MHLPLLAPAIRKWQDLDDQNWSNKPIFLTCHTDNYPKCNNANYVYQRIRTYFKCRKNDVYLVTYPKEGTTWTLSILERLNQLEVDGKFKENDKVKLGMSKEEIGPWPEVLAEDDDYLESFRFLDRKSKERTRYFKTHSPITLLPNLDPNRIFYQKQADLVNFKIISIFRNPLDQMVSHWHHTVGKHVFEYKGSFEDFFEICLNGKDNRNNIYDSGGRLSENGDWFLWHEEVLEFYEKSEKSKILLETYENLQKDNSKSFIKNLAKFLDLKSDLITGNEAETNISKISNLCDFQTMKKVQIEKGFICTSLTYMRNDKIGDKNQASSAHVREGKVGGWENYYTKEMLERWEEHVESKRESCPLMFKYLGEEYLCGRSFETRIRFS